MFQLKWGCNLLVQHGANLQPPVPAIHMPVRVVGKQVHGAAEVINGVGEDQGLAPARTRAGSRRPVPVGILVVHGVVLPTGISRV